MDNVYYYLASENPYVAESIIREFGYKPSGNDLGYSLSALVAAVGEPALKRVMQNHPDKEVILEMFSSSKPAKKNMCGCNSNAYLNASGNSMAAMANNHSTNQYGTYLLAASIFLAAAIIVTKK